MSDTICRHCGAATSNGLVLCDMAQTKARVDLEFLPVYFRNLARWRAPARPNGSSGTSGQWIIQRGESENNQIGHALERAANDLTTWARALADDRGIQTPADADTEAATVAGVCVWLADHLTSIGTLEWAGQFVADIARHEARLRALTEISVPGWYAGACRRCEAPTYVVPGLSWLTCRACGMTTYARDHLDTIRNEASDWVAPPRRLAEAIVALVDTELSVPRLHERIRKWGLRERIEGVRRLDQDGDPTGPKSYRFGDVLDLLLVEGETRPAEDSAADVAVVAS